MNRFHSFWAIFTLFYSGAFLFGDALDQLTIDATAQVSRPPPSRGPFPGSASPGHSTGLPIRLELRIPTGQLRPNGSTLIDFVITNIGSETIKLPSSVAMFNFEPREALNLWVTSDAIKDQYLKDSGSGRLVKIEIVGINAELDGSSAETKSLYVLAPNKSLLVHASSPWNLKPGTHSFTAHAELLHVSNGSSERVGTADSRSVTTTLLTSSSTR
jgi:hypothetical protein